MQQMSLTRTLLMEGLCQLQLCIHCHLSFDTFPYPLVIPSLFPLGISQSALEAIGSYTKTFSATIYILYFLLLSSKPPYLSQIVNIKTF